MSQAWDPESDDAPPGPRELEFGGDPDGLEIDAQRAGVLESLIREVVRRAASVGFSSFFTTEEALRQAFNDSVPREWVDFVARQGEDVRAQLFETLSSQFGQWLREIDVAEVLGEVLRRQDISLRLELSSRKAGAVEGSPRSTLEVLSPKK